ncbi:slipin family protein [Microscilla marina]|uniref:slipin family protein n=1 Tax=Microscilla marina TaxID=1027 RepID=UPI0005D482A7|nr:slipin family protein [Microscilla marina]
MKFRFKLHYKKQVWPNHKGYLYINQKFDRTVESGVYKFSKFSDNVVDIYPIPMVNQWISIVNQEVLTQDNISLRVSYEIEFKVTDYGAFRPYANLSTGNAYNTNIFTNINLQIRNIAQTLVRNTLASAQSELLNEQRGELLGNLKHNIQQQLVNQGVEITQVLLNNIMFPKKIQELFAQQLEANIRAKADLDKARTQVATARALKNAADLMSDNENIKFLKMMETITQIAASGKHTFMIGGELYQPSDKK